MAAVPAKYRKSLRQIITGFVLRYADVVFCICAIGMTVLVVSQMQNQNRWGTLPFLLLALLATFVAGQLSRERR